MWERDAHVVSPALFTLYTKKKGDVDLILVVPRAGPAPWEETWNRFLHNRIQEYIYICVCVLGQRVGDGNC